MGTACLGERSEKLIPVSNATWLGHAMCPASLLLPFSKKKRTSGYFVGRNTTRHILSLSLVLVRTDHSVPSGVAVQHNHPDLV